MSGGFVQTSTLNSGSLAVVTGKSVLVSRQLFEPYKRLSPHMLSIFQMSYRRLAD